MILFYAPGACSLADHIALNEAKLAFDAVKVDLKTHTTEDGRDLHDDQSYKGYVPDPLRLDGGENAHREHRHTELDRRPGTQGLTPPGDLGRYRLLETLAFISTEIHKAFKPFFSAGSTEAEKARAGQAIAGRLEPGIAGQLKGDYLFGQDVERVADAYSHWVMLTWAKRNGVEIPQPLAAFFDRMNTRPAVQLALKAEGLA